MDILLKNIIKNNKHLTKKAKLADYIPALAKANIEEIGITIIDMENNIYQEGDFKKKFTIQSISKVLVLFLAIMDNSAEKVFEKIGYEGTDEPFNTLFKLDLPNTMKPPNPMVNSGAILATSLIKGQGEEKFHRILSFFRQVTENPNLSYNKEVYLSEKNTGDKNRALGYLMKSRNFFQEDVESTLDVYFKQCSIEVNTRDLAKIGLFLGDRNKKSRDKDMYKIKQIITAIMTTSGMYNFSGEYAVEVGIPSKSGVGGGIVGTVPNKMGIGVYSPGLDEYGNSLVGYEIMKDLSKEFNLALF